MMTRRRRSRTSSAPRPAVMATTAPHPEWTLTPIAADFIRDTLLRNSRKITTFLRAFSVQNRPDSYAICPMGTRSKVLVDLTGLRPPATLFGDFASHLTSTRNRDRLHYKAHPPGGKS